MPLRAGGSNSTKRTPRSTIRRASRHWRPNSSVSGSSRPYILRVASRLLRQIEQVRHRGLHAEGEFVVADRRFHFGDAAEAVEHAVVQRSQQAELCLLQLAAIFARLSRSAIGCAPLRNSVPW